jgi:hypothetical protein
MFALPSLLGFTSSTTEYTFLAKRSCIVLWNFPIYYIHTGPSTGYIRELRVNECRKRERVKGVFWYHCCSSSWLMAAILADVPYPVGVMGHTTRHGAPLNKGNPSQPRCYSRRHSGGRTACQQVLYKVGSWDSACIGVCGL